MDILDEKHNKSIYYTKPYTNAENLKQNNIKINKKRSHKMTYNKFP